MILNKNNKAKPKPKQPATKNEYHQQYSYVYSSYVRNYYS